MMLSRRASRDRVDVVFGNTRPPYITRWPDALDLSWTTVVRAGDLILELVPTGGELIVEVKLKPADVATIRVGLPTSIKLDSYDYTIYGALRGKVRYVSPDALSERTAQGELTYYRVQIAIDRPQPEAQSKDRPDRRIEIQPGMTCVVDIETGHHTVLSYLTKPITKTLSESMRER